MKVAVKNEKVRTIIPRPRRDLAEDRDAESVTEDVVSTSYDVPTSSVAKISALLGVILTVVQTLASLVTGWLVDIPKSRADIRLGQAEVRLIESNFRLQTLQRVLEDADPKRRADSLKLLVASGILDDPNGKILQLASATNGVPQWGSRPLEPLKETLTLVRGSANVQVSSSASNSGNLNRNINGNGSSNSNTNTNTNTITNTNTNARE
jgi:hypothetical protein